VAVELKYQASLSCVVSCVRNPGAFRRKLEGSGAAEDDGVGAQEWRVISMSFEIDIYPWRRTWPRLQSMCRSSGLEIVIATCRLCNLRGRTSTRHKSTTIESSRGCVSMKI